MRRPWPAFMLLLGGALLLVALYLPWQRVSLDRSFFEDQGETVAGLLELFGGRDSLDGWESGVAPATALAALLLVGLSAAAWARPLLADQLPLGRCGLVAGYFTLAVAVDTRSGARTLTGGNEDGVDIVFAYGTYVGLSAGAVVLLSALMLRRAELLDYWSPGAAAGGILVSGLLVGFLLPWERFGWFQATGISVPAAQVAALFALCLPSAWRSGPPLRFGLAFFAALFTAAAFSTITTALGFARAYGSWVAIGCAIGLVVLSLSRGVRRPAIQRLPWSRLVLGAACLLLVASFFLPWQEVCPPPGRCVSMNGWPGESAATAAILAIALILRELVRLRRTPPRAELAAGIALFVTTLGFQVGYGGEVGLRYGFWVGAACTGAIVVLAAAGLRRPPLDARLAPVALCLAYLSVVVPTWWGALRLDAPRYFWFAPFSWITIVGALLALTLIRLWLERAPDTRQLFLVPAVMAALATLDLVGFEAITWGGGIVLGLCALLALCALVEHAGGLRRLEIPGVLRLDRL